MPCNNSQRNSFTKAHRVELKLLPAARSRRAVACRRVRLSCGACHVRDTACAARVVGRSIALLQVALHGSTPALMRGIQRQLSLARTSLQPSSNAAACLPSSSSLQPPHLTSTPCCASPTAAPSAVASVTICRAQMRAGAMPPRCCSRVRRTMAHSAARERLAQSLRV